MAERDAVPTIPGPIPQTTTSAPRRRRLRQRRGDRDALEVAVQARRDGERRVHQPPRLSARSVSESDTGSAPPAELNVGDPSSGERRADRRELAVEAAAHDREPVEPLGRDVSSACLLREARRELPGRVGERHHVGTVLGREAEARVRFAYSTSNPPEPSSSSDACVVDEHDVAFLDRRR